jgi:hypothetical protein
MAAGLRRGHMNFLHYTVDAGPENVVRVNLTGPANVRLLDPLNFAKYRLAKRYIATAGPETQSPIKFVPPFKGKWHVVVDVEGQAGGVRASVDVQRL